MRYRVGTRGSKLALAQTTQVIEQLNIAFPEDEFDTVIIKTTGDMDQKSRLDQIGSKGIFVKEIEEELLEEKIHLAVHSMKDMPDTPADGLIFAKSWKREDPRDVLILREAASVEELPRGAVIGTGSKRRKYQLLNLRPDLHIVGIRGNVDTRIRKMQEEEMDGIVLAAAGMKRLGREQEITCYLEPELMIPAPAQGTLALEVKADNIPLIKKLNTLSDKETDLCVKAERQFLKQIGGSCHLPVGAYCKIQDEKLVLRAMFGTEDGKKLAYATVESDILNGRKELSELNETCRQIAGEAVEKICTQLSSEE